MSDILDLARAHYSRMRNQKLEIPEWAGEDGAPAEITFSPLTLRQRQKLQARVNGDNPARLMALCVILFAKRADGSALFEDTPATLKAMENDISPAVIARIAAAMMGGSDEADGPDGDPLGN